MERMEYDPEGGDYQPITEHEKGATFMVVGLVMLLGGLGWLLFTGWDIRQAKIHAGDTGSGCCDCPGPESGGFQKKKRQIN